MILRDFRKVCLSFYNNDLIIIDKDYKVVKKTSLSYESFEKYKDCIIDTIDTTCSCENFENVVKVKAKLIITIFEN